MSKKKQTNNKPTCMHYETEICPYNEKSVMKKCHGTGVMKTLKSKRETLNCYQAYNQNNEQSQDSGELNNLESRV